METRTISVPEPQVIFLLVLWVVLFTISGTFPHTYTGLYFMDDLSPSVSLCILPKFSFCVALHYTVLCLENPSYSSRINCLFNPGTWPQRVPSSYMMAMKLFQENKLGKSQGSSPLILASGISGFLKKWFIHAPWLAVQSMWAPVGPGWFYRFSGGFLQHSGSFNPFSSSSEGFAKLHLIFGCEALHPISISYWVKPIWWWLG